MTRTAVLFCLLGFSAPAGAEVVLLATGALLEGQVDRRSDQVVVRGPGVEIVLRPDEVLHVDQSRLAVYEWIRRERVGDAEGHLYLANWAMENRLWPQAARELLDARQADPRDPRLARLERQLDELSRPRPEAKAPQAASAVEEPIAVANAPHPLPELPAGSLEHFTRRIQPLLRNGCVECHRGGEGDSLGLNPHWVRGHANAQTTDHNLRAVLAQIDLGSPEASRLLAAARGPHHGVTPFRGPRRDELIARLEAWVQSLAAANPQGVTPPPAYAGGSLPSSSVESVAVREDFAVEPAGYAEPVVSPPAPPRRGVRLKRVEPRDEFDPAIFNERFRRPEDDLPQ